MHGLLALTAYLTALALAYVSGVVPAVNGELLLLSYVALSGTGPASALTFAAIVALGQMGGKATMYWAGRGAATIPGERRRRALERWEGRFRRSPRAVMLFVLLSAVTGFPPFYVVSILAGTFRLNFAAFFAVGLAGRLARFAAIALFPAALGQLRHGS